MRILIWSLNVNNSANVLEYYQTTNCLHLLENLQI